MLSFDADEHRDDNFDYLDDKRLMTIMLIIDDDDERDDHFDYLF